MVCALRFEEGRVHFTNRFVRSSKFVAEEKAGRALFRAFGTRFEWDRLEHGIALSSPVNVSVYALGGRLLAMGEQGIPWELDPVSLETIGPFTAAGRLNPISPFAAHPKFDPETGEMFNFGVSFSASQPSLALYHFDGEAQLVDRWRLPLPFPCSIHDFCVSQRYAIIYLSPYLLDIEGMIRGGQTVMEALRWQPSLGSRLRIVTRDTGEEVAEIPVGSRYCLHHINSFEQGGLLNIDVLELEEPVYGQYEVLPDIFTDVPEAYPVRFVVDTAAGRLVDRREVDYRLAPDLPGIDAKQAGRPYRNFWTPGISATGRPGRKMFDELVRIDWDTGAVEDRYQAPPGIYLCGEPVVVADPSETSRSALICQLFDADSVTSSFVVFDAFSIGQGPVATIRLPSPIHFGFHACFSSA
jgi:all-trans-8'-apo-beta-carotenal 15,15'-oxygenase